ncbi:ABC-type multidrug transport system, ATPase component [Thermoplasmatales archaeon BRNA1]|nr:ABC-type multidrug transport system, ATPase component [Thermoplasmatales archaeon BRNA1]
MLEGLGMSDFPIEIVNLRKVYGSFVAVDDLNLEIKKNSFTGLLGPNGAGKSTSLKILTNLITATSGHAFINGYDVAKDPKNALQGVGTVVETPEFYLYLTPRETFRYVGEIFGMSRESISAETDTILAKVKMSEWEDKRLGTFSKGMRQRITLGLSLLNDPSVIILDEPTSGLDPRGMAEMREILKNIRNDNNNLTVLMSSHMMHEVTDLCDRIALINHGQLLMHDDISSFIEGSDVRTLIVRTIEIPNDDMISRIAGLPNVRNAYRSGNEIAVKIEGSKTEEVSFIRDLMGLNLSVFSVAESENALENRYLELVAESR